MGTLFNRTFSLNLGGTRVASETTDGARNEILRVQFKVEADLSKSPNTAEIAVYNLAESTRAKVSERDIVVSLEVGYSGQSSEIFLGKLEAGRNQRDGVDWVTTFQSTDGGKELRQGRINFSSKRISVSSAFEKVVEAMGLNLGNGIEKMRAGNLRGVMAAFENGLVLSGSARKELDKLASTFGYSWSVQNGQLQLLGPRDAIEPGDAIVLDSNTGMVGSPESGDDGVVEVRALLIPQLTPGRVVALSSQQASGFYRVEKVTYLGDTRGNDWYADLELIPR